ncbi:MAG: hypothetical protein AAGK37_17890 [Pseudomonadota bacterium]
MLRWGPGPWTRLPKAEVSPLFSVTITRMGREDYTRAASLLFGGFTVFCVVVVLGFTVFHFSGTGSGYWFGFLVWLFFHIVALLFGWAFLIPKKSIPVFRRLAEAIDPHFVRFLCAICIFVSFSISLETILLFVGTNLHFAESIVVLINITLIILLFPFFVFVFPGSAWFGIISRMKGRDLRDFGVPIVEKLRQDPAILKIVIIASLICYCVGLAYWMWTMVPIGHRQTIASQAWFQLTRTPATAIGVGVAVVVMFSWTRVLSRKDYVRSTPAVLVYALFFLLTSIGGTKAILQTAIPEMAAKAFGSEMIMFGTIVETSLQERRKFCSGTTLLFIEGREQEFCNVSQEFFAIVESGDGIAIRGRGTWFGLIPEQVMKQDQIASPDEAEDSSDP